MNLHLGNKKPSLILIVTLKRVLLLCLCIIRRIQLRRLIERSRIVRLGSVWPSSRQISVGEMVLKYIVIRYQSSKIIVLTKANPKNIEN